MLVSTSLNDWFVLSRAPNAYCFKELDIDHQIEIMSCYTTRNELKLIVIAS